MTQTREMHVLLKAVQEAGKAIAKLAQTHFIVTQKSNHDPLTEADLLANQILKQHLLENFPNDGWLSEETIDNPERLQKKRVWIIDPIDGTKEFIKGIPEYAVSAALVENGITLVGVVFNPITDELFSAMRGQGAWLNGSPIHCDHPYQGKLKILASRTEMAEGSWIQFAKENDVQVVGSIAYKLALVAAGYAHATFSLGPKSEWDIAAGTLLIKEAGGVVTDKMQKEFVFNQANVRVNGIVACSKATYPMVIGMTG